MPSSEWVEEQHPDEEAQFAQLAERLASMQRARADGERALHAKMHAGFTARLEVRENLPAPLAQGLFARPGEYRAYVRFSNGSGAQVADSKPDVRGLAIKLLGVDGPKALEQSRTQDFLLIDTPTVPFLDPTEFVAFAVAAGSGKPTRLVTDLGWWRTLKMLRRLVAQAPRAVIDLADLAYYGPAPIKFGPYAARMSAVPTHAKGSATRPGAGPDYLGERLRERVEAGGLKFCLRAQLYEQGDAPLDDSTVLWQGSVETVATLSIDRQATNAELTRYIKELRFDPWHALIEHRPLGALMRARRATYPASTAQRPTVPEPDGADFGQLGPSVAASTFA